MEIDKIVDEIIKRIKNEEDDSILVEASGRHVHLSKEHVEILFGKGYELTKARELSQPGQYLCEEKVTVIGSKGTFHNVSVLGPVRNESQLELSRTDAVSIGVNAPVRMSGDIENSGTAIIATPNAAIKLHKGAIAAKRHLHITPDDAKRYGLTDKEEICIKTDGERGVIFTNVAVRVSEKFKTTIHLDYDEANACGFVKGMHASIIKNI